MFLFPDTKWHQSPDSLWLRLGVCVRRRVSWARRLPRQGRAAPAVQAGGAAAGGDIAAVTAAGGGVGGGSGDNKTWGTPTLQGRTGMGETGSAMQQVMMMIL